MTPTDVRSTALVSAALTAPLFNWLDHRATGVLVHPTSLPGLLGIGTFDEATGPLLDFLAAAGIQYWQLCPLGPTGYGDSPYQCFSSFAGNPYLIDPAALVRRQEVLRRVVSDVDECAVHAAPSPAQRGFSH